MISEPRDVQDRVASYETAVACLLRVRNEVNIDIAAARRSGLPDHNSVPVSRIIELVEELGLGVRWGHLDWQELHQTSISHRVLAVLNNNNVVILMQSAGGNEDIAVWDPVNRNGAVFVVTRETLERNWDGQALIISRQPAGAAETTLSVLGFTSGTRNVPEPELLPKIDQEALRREEADPQPLPKGSEWALVQRLSSGAAPQASARPILGADAPRGTRIPRLARASAIIGMIGAIGILVVVAIAAQKSAGLGKPTHATSTKIMDNPWSKSETEALHFTLLPALKASGLPPLAADAHVESTGEVRSGAAGPSVPAARPITRNPPTVSVAGKGGAVPTGEKPRTSDRVVEPNAVALVRSGSPVGPIAAKSSMLEGMLISGPTVQSIPTLMTPKVDQLVAASGSTSQPNGTLASTGTLLAATGPRESPTPAPEMLADTRQTTGTGPITAKPNSTAPAKPARSAAPVAPPPRVPSVPAAIPPLTSAPVRAPDVATSAASVPNDIQRFNNTEIAALVAHGDSVLGLGDIASARLFYERAAEAGDARAALRLGATFDPAFLAHAGMPSDTKQALYWYRRARDLGAPKAEQWIKELDKNVRQ